MSNRQTWCSIYLLWHYVCLRRTVVYESADMGVLYVINGASGDIRALCTKASEASVPELRDANTIFIFDTKAGRGTFEPASCSAFLILMASQNERNYGRTIEEFDARYCIPSYTVEELLAVCHIFDVTEAEVRERCSIIGPSIRYVLQHFGTEYVREILDAKMMHVTVKDMMSAFGADRSDSMKFLLKVVVDEEIYENPNDAYKLFNAQWLFASEYIVEKYTKAAK